MIVLKCITSSLTRSHQLVCHTKMKLFKKKKGKKVEKNKSIHYRTAVHMFIKQVSVVIRALAAFILDNLQENDYQRINKN